METRISSRSNVPLRRIALVTETYAPETNGVANTLRNLTRELRTEGCTVDLVVPRHPLRADRDTLLSRPHSDAPTSGELVCVTALPLPGYSNVRCGVVAPRKLMALWRRRTPEVVYVATEGPLGLAALAAANRLGIAVVSGFHTRFDMYSRHYLGAALQPWVTRYLRRFHNRTAATLVPDVNLAKQLDAAGYVGVQVLQRGVDTEQFHPRFRSQELRQRWGAVDGAPVLLYVGRLAAEKNLRWVLRAFRAVRSRQPRARCVLVGDGPLRRSLQQTEPGLIFAGAQRGDELARSYASADLFLFPSLSETFGNVTLEAMASGLPVVAFDYAAAANHITNGHDGYLAPLGRCAQWLDAAVALAALPEDARRAVGQRARRAVVDVSWQQVASRFRAILSAARSATEERRQYDATGTESSTAVGNGALPGVVGSALGAADAPVFHRRQPPR